MKEQDTGPLLVAVCGPSSEKCKCACPDGPCEHVWDGPTNRTENSESATCSRCGADSMAHAMWCF